VEKQTADYSHLPVDVASADWPLPAYFATANVGSDATI
jgi:hypothetical protein